MNYSLGHFDNHYVILCLDCIRILFLDNLRLSFRKIKYAVLECANLEGLKIRRGSCSLYTLLCGHLWLIFMVTGCLVAAISQTLKSVCLL